ncbi:hypothetical protein NX722_08780 [Endozoicomonas gorgoniicola]|uniref:MBL fold metallo-hydrolase n=1 Tax=Endozoicomonas gorgoniicola TaxID=1234144 RepID=A0ABT3MUH7_9GAMM|nr:hypothetical protein [Endozoicomonas gorgoniicola]MCW7552733.1 hypothetical protein [Endozoicomonas gorgoniicola]
MPSHIKIYIENYISKINGEDVEYTIDFDSIESGRTLLKSISQTAEYNPDKFYNLRLRYSGRHRMHPGSWYSLPIKLFSKSEYDDIGEDDEGSGGYSGIIKVKKSIDNYTQYLTSQSKHDYKVFSDIEIGFKNTIKELSVINCGQGNWNEIHTDNEILIYDTGASSRYKTSEIQDLVEKRFSTFKNKEICIIISHWDMDHFQALKYLSDHHLRGIKYIYGPSNIPNSNVYKSTVEHLKSKNVGLTLISPSTKRTGRAINLNQVSSSNSVDVYRAVNGRSRNQTGIVLVIKGNSKITILTGDPSFST